MGDPKPVTGRDPVKRASIGAAGWRKFHSRLPSSGRSRRKYPCGESSQKLKNSLSLHLREWPHGDSSVTRTASIRRACVSWRTRLRVSRLFLAPEAVSFEDAEHLETATIGEGGELGNLPLAGLIGGGDPGVDGGALSPH